MLTSCLNAYVLSSLECCAPVRMSSTESHLGLIDSIGRSVERLCEGELSCLAHRRKVRALCLLYKIYHVDHHMNGYLNDFVATRNTRASASQGEFALVLPRCRTDQFSRSFLPAAGVCETYCRRACLVVAPWALIWVRWTCA